MQIHQKTIDHGTLRRLVDAGAHVGAEVVGAPGGWGVVISYGRASQTLAVTRGEARTFRKFETVAAYLKELGITDLRVHTAEFDPGAVAKPTDKRSELATERMKRAHEAAAHDKWFREQVEIGLAEADDLATEWVPHDVVKADMAQQRAALMARIAKGP
jgi:ribonuclease HI